VTITQPRRWHLLTGEYPPAIGGIARFTAALAPELRAQGADPHIWVPGGGGTGNGVPVHGLPDNFGTRSRSRLRKSLAPDDVILVQYTPNAFGLKGANLPFCHWLQRQAARGRDVRVMFHEPFFYFGWQSIPRNGLALVQRAMAALLLRASSVVYVSTPSWVPLLSPYTVGSRKTYSWVPVPTAIPVLRDPDRVSRWRAAMMGGIGGPLIGHFSSFPPDVQPGLHHVIRGLLSKIQDAHVLCIGKGSVRFADAFAREEPSLGWRLHATGELDPADVSCAIQICTVFVQPYPDGATGRRTSLTTLLAHGATVVSTIGRLTEDLWTAGEPAMVMLPAVEYGQMVEAADKLVHDPARRATLSRGARQIYERTFTPAAAAAAVLRGAAVVEDASCGSS